MREKTDLADFAIFGGAPAFSNTLHVGRPNVGDRERFLRRVGAMLDRNWLTNDGPLVREFEERIAELAGVRHCVATCNATLGLELLIRACDLAGEVIVPSFTFVATAHAVRMSGLTPVFGDIDETSHSLDPDALEDHLSERTSAILGVHLWGRSCAIEALTKLADRHGLTLLFDAAHAFGGSFRRKTIGRFGRAEVFSFHATKFINSFEGGAITTQDADLAARLRRMRNFGFVDYDEVRGLGSNAKMSEVAAAMGLTNLEAMPRIIAANAANYEQYREALSDLPGIEIYLFDASERNNFQYVVIEVDEVEAGLSRDDLVSLLHAENVLARRYFYPGCHRMEPYRTTCPAPALPITEKVAARVFQLPTGTSVGDASIRAVAGVLRLALENPRAVQAKLSSRGVGDG